MVNIINLHNYAPVAFNWRYGSMLVILSAALAALFLLVSLRIVKPILVTIIEAHGGKLWATQNRVQGVTIQFALNCEGAES